MYICKQKRLSKRLVIVAKKNVGTIFIGLLVFFCGQSILAQNPVVDEILNRLDRLETQNQALHFENARLSELVGGSPTLLPRDGDYQSTRGIPSSLTHFRMQENTQQQPSNDVADATSTSQATAAQQLQSGMMEMKNGMEKLQEGLETVGKNLRVTTVDENWKVAVFGSLTGEMIFAEQRPVIPTGIVLLSPDFGQDTPTVAISGKQSSLGAAFVGPEIHGLKTGGLFLTYFFGEDYLADQPGFFVVRGYGELKNEFWRFAVGTDADVINPLKPNMLDFNTGNGAGNMGFFRGQFRVERYFHFGHNQLTTQLALGNPITTSFNGDVRNRLESNGSPNVDARIALGLGQLCERNGVKSRPVELGISGLIGQLRRTGTPVSELDVWAMGADGKIALTDRCGIQGEFFHGQAIGNYNAGITQIFNLFTLQPIRSTGGWGELYFNWTGRLHSHVGYGVDDPLDSTLSPTLPTRNSFAFANLIWDVTKNLEIGLEVDHWETDFVAAPALGAFAPGDNDAMIYRTRVSLKF